METQSGTVTIRNGPSLLPIITFTFSQWSSPEQLAASAPAA